VILIRGDACSKGTTLTPPHLIVSVPSQESNITFIYALGISARILESIQGHCKDDALPFKPYVIKNVGGHRIAVIGQAFPRTSNANPQKYFFPDWSFGLREDEMAELVADIRENEKPDAVIVISHNGMDVDIKMASRVVGIDAIFGGHKQSVF
jgi:2',3'-cyclic-nucleotide 2'-phosphodiesterase (5'-nucleotidase family)